MPKVRAHWGAIGDSITAGWGTSDPGTKAYPVIAKVPAVGRPGQTLTHPNDWNPKPVTGTLGGDINTLKAQGVNAIAVEIGINETGYVEDDQVWKDAYNRLFVIAKNHHVHMVLATITPFGPAKLADADTLGRRNRMNKWIRNWKPYVEYSVPLGNSTLKPEYDCGDGTHPSDAGAAAIAAALVTYKALHKYIAKP